MQNTNLLGRVEISIDNFTFLGDTLKDTEGLLTVHRLLNDVFTTFYQHANFCDRQEGSRQDFVLLHDNLRDWVELCYHGHQAAIAEQEAEKMLQSLEEMREKIVNKRNSCKK